MTAILKEKKAGRHISQKVLYITIEIKITDKKKNENLDREKVICAFLKLTAN